MDNDARTPAEPRPAGTDTHTPPAQREVRVKRSLRPLPFLLIGLALGCLAGLLLDALGGEARGYSQATSAGFLGVVGALLGAILGGTVWALIDRVQR